MKLSCEIVQDLLPLYCDGVCSRESRRAVEDHLRDCAACRGDARLLEREAEAETAGAGDQKIAQAAAAAWKRGRARAFLKGCLLALLGIALLAAGYGARHWFSTADGDDLDALARQAADYLRYDELRIERVARRGDYLAALCRDPAGNWSLCEFDRDSLFENRWRANGGKLKIEDGTAGSWNYGSPRGEAVLIFCGGNLPEEVRWYRFQNGGITYTCPVEDNQILDIFLIPDSTDINGAPVLLDREQREIG